MSEKSNKRGFYIIPLALCVAFLIRGMILHETSAAYADEDLSIWQSPTFYYVLSAACFILGLFLLNSNRRNKD